MERQSLAPPWIMKMPSLFPSGPVGILAGSVGSYTMQPISQSMPLAWMRKTSSVSV